MYDMLSTVIHLLSQCALLLLGVAYPPNDLEDGSHAKSYSFLDHCEYKWSEEQPILSTQLQTDRYTITMLTRSTAIKMNTVLYHKFRTSMKCPKLGRIHSSYIFVSPASSFSAVTYGFSSDVPL